jgi:predicted hydrocarbon binding protein
MSTTTISKTAETEVRNQSEGSRNAKTGFDQKQKEKSEQLSRNERRHILRTWALGLNDEDSETVRHSLEFRSKDGVIMNNLGPQQRIFFLGADNWADIESCVDHKTASEPYLILQKMGYKYGDLAAKKLKPPSRSISTLRKIASGSGFGTLNIRTEENGAWIRVDVENCVFCYGFGREHNCNFLSGIIQGMAEEINDRSYKIIRNQCYLTNGVHACEVVLQEAYYDPAAKRRAILGRVDNPLGEEFL